MRTKPGDRVMMASPHGRLTKGGQPGAYLVIPNGELGTVIAAAAADAPVGVTFDLLKGVAVSVPVHWLEPSPLEPRAERGD